MVELTTNYITHIMVTTNKGEISMNKITVRELKKRLNDLTRNHPERLDLPVITSADDEGNSFHQVWYYASVGQFDEETRDFTGADESGNGIVNCICLN